MRAEGIDPDEQELVESLAATAEREQVPAEDLLERLRTAGRLEELREDLAARRAIELIAQAAKPIPIERARAREQLWTPGKERTERAREDGEQGSAESVLQEAGGLWTPER